MCGIVGAIGELGFQEKKALAQLLQVDVLRGPHSTGVAIYNNPKGNTKRGITEILKGEGLPQYLLNSKRYENITQGLHRGYIGHNRFATTGAINSDNAHPFHHGSIVGVHNGTLDDVYDMPDFRDFDVDSENIMHSINKIGVSNTIKKMSGSWCLAFFDEEEGTFNLIRNSERPMFNTATSTGEVFFASEDWMLAGVLGRKGIKHGDIIKIPEDTLFTWDLNYEKGRLQKPKARKIEGKKLKPPVYSQAGGYHYSNRKQISCGAGYSDKKKKLGMWSGGREWREGDSISFYANDLTLAERAAVGCLTGHTATVKSQTIIAYPHKTSRTFETVSKDKGKGSLFMGKIQSMWEKKPAGRTQGIQIMLDPTSICKVGEKGEVVRTVKKKKLVGPDGEEVSSSRYRELTKHCCAWCSSPATEMMSEKILWLGNKTEWLCPDCQDEDDVKEYLDMEDNDCFKQSVLL